MHGQLESGCWTDRVDLDPIGKHTGLYRHRKGNLKGRNYSTLDDDKSQSALRLLIEVDRAHGSHNEPIHEAVMYGLEALLKAPESLAKSSRKQEEEVPRHRADERRR